jgi:serine/threonine protein kinase
MAPERIVGAGTADHRAGIYSLACLRHECLTGQRPFPGEELAALLNAHLNLDPPTPSELVTGLPAALDDVVANRMAKNPDRR